MRYLRACVWKTWEYFLRVQPWVKCSYRHDPGWSKLRGCCRRSVWCCPAVSGVSAEGCWATRPCKAEPQIQTRRRPNWWAYANVNTNGSVNTHLKWHSHVIKVQSITKFCWVIIVAQPSQSQLWCIKKTLNKRFDLRFAKKVVRRS